MAWTIGVEVPDELAQRGCSVSQAPFESNLGEHPGTAGLYSLSSPLGAVTVRCASDSELAWEFPAEEPRVFKLVGARGDRGRRMQLTSTGLFLVVVPAGTRPDMDSCEWLMEGPDAITGATAVGYVGRFTDRPVSPAVFVASDGRPWDLPRARGCVELVGSTVDDELDRLGPLFVGEPPRVEVRGGWRVERFVVLVNQSADDGGAWRTHGSQFEPLRAEIAAMRCGWFSVRCYDENDDPIEIMPFRFSASLKRIEIKDPPDDALPGQLGYNDAVVLFVHGNECRVTLAGAAPGVRVEPNALGTQVLLNARPECDETRWKVTEAMGECEIRVRVERVWWTIAEEAVTEDRVAWTDHALDLRRDDFVATSSKVLHVRLPRDVWKATVGFVTHRALTMQGSKNGLHRSLPLRNLTDQRELSGAAQELSLRLFLARPGSARSASAVVARVVTSRTQSARFRRLDTAALSSARVASALTRFARSLPAGRARRALRQFRRERYAAPRRNRDVTHQEFVRAALCLLDAICERGGASVDALPRRWRERARAASDEFPEVAEEVERFLDCAMGVSRA